MAHLLVIGAYRDNEVDVVAGVGWTARDAWWALTRDPMVWGEYLPRAEALVLAVGGMDALPAAVPTYLRQGIAYIRPGWVRRKVRGLYLELSPRVMAITGGPLRQCSGIPDRPVPRRRARSCASLGSHP